MTYWISITELRALKKISQIYGPYAQQWNMTKNTASIPSVWKNAKAITPRQKLECYPYGKDLSWTDRKKNKKI